ncbi:dynein axonemal intermediate chain 7 homolog isoform X2 [Plodia interpunctella]|uniref:dynein axonemal intermediate chain 7 homolog isoform X2 n=1 Tax=Plodia interpunctella TaxID=58824 RepID=UPI002368C1D3|nr:dynein axonemal intermediate chain 7 homolog isoform X2 [Plodia interpunctella]
MGKGKDKRKKDEPPPEPEPEEVVQITELEPEPEEIQFTDTSYTSASFEELPPPPEEPVKKKPKKGKKGKVASEVVVKDTSELFNWSEESLAEEQAKPVEEEEAPKKKKGKKGKKDKEPKEEIPDFEKPKNWKKMNKKEREAWLVERIEQWRAEKEAEKQAILAGAKEKRAAAARERAELMAKDNEEQEIRRDILQKACNLFSKFEKQKFEYLNKKQLNAEWQQYLRCDGLPDARVVTQMNTYLHLWQNNVDRGVCDDNELDRRCIEALPMLEMLEEFVANSRQYTPLQAQGYNEVRLALRESLSQAIQLASYTLLRDLEKRLKFHSIKLATYEREFKGLKLNIWVAVRMPTRKIRPVEPEREPVELTFPAIQVSVKLPKIIDGSCVCVRAARSMLDLQSESSRTFALAAEMPNRYEDLFIYNVKEHVATYKLKKEQDETRSKFFAEIRAKVRELENFLKANIYTKNEKEKEELDNLNMMEPQNLPDPRTYIGEQNEMAFAKYLKTCMTRTRAGEINLRKYRICGGVLYLDLLMTPPQPKRLCGDLILATLQLPKALQPMKYQVQYRAPGPPPSGVVRTPEEIEAEMKKIEAEYEKLALVFIELPQDVMWSEPPVVCQWQEARKLWTSNYINDFKFNEDKFTVQFRTGVLWPIGIATLRYSNLPYQSWDIKPDTYTKGVIITVTGVCVTITWLCLGNTVRLKFIANSTTNALKDHYNKPYSVKKMI